MKSSTKQINFIKIYWLILLPLTITSFLSIFFYQTIILLSLIIYLSFAFYAKYYLYNYYDLSNKIISYKMLIYHISITWFLFLFFFISINWIINDLSSESFNWNLFALKCYCAIISLYHFGEFLHEVNNEKKPLGFDAYLLFHSWAYLLFNVIFFSEYLIGCLFFSNLKSNVSLLYILKILKIFIK